MFLVVSAVAAAAALRKCNAFRIKCNSVQDKTFLIYMTYNISLQNKMFGIQEMFSHNNGKSQRILHLGGGDVDCSNVEICMPHAFDNLII